MISSFDDRGGTAAFALTRLLWVMYWESDWAAGHAISPHMPGRTKTWMGNNCNCKECKEQRQPLQFQRWTVLHMAQGYSSNDMVGIPMSHACEIKLEDEQQRK